MADAMNGAPPFPSEPVPHSQGDLVTLACDSDGVALVALCDPASKNAITPALASELEQVLYRASAWQGLKVVVLLGLPEVFCAGASREVLLRSLAARLPQAAWVAEGGFLLGRDGHEACQLGPLVAQDAVTAKALLEAALARVPAPLYVDVADHAAGLRAWLESLGFAFQRPFTRMVHGAGGAPGDESKVMLVAGPELG